MANISRCRLRFDQRDLRLAYPASTIDLSRSILSLRPIGQAKRSRGFSPAILSREGSRATSLNAFLFSWGGLQLCGSSLTGESLILWTENVNSTSQHLLYEENDNHRDHCANTRLSSSTRFWSSMPSTGRNTFVWFCHTFVFGSPISVHSCSWHFWDRCAICSTFCTYSARQLLSVSRRGRQ